MNNTFIRLFFLVLNFLKIIFFFKVAFSRLMTRAFLDMAKEKFHLRDQKVISYGPCQTPTLWFCAQRHKEIQNFRSTPFYVVSVVVNVQVGFFTFLHK